MNSDRMIMIKSVIDHLEKDFPDSKWEDWVAITRGLLVSLLQGKGCNLKEAQLNLHKTWMANLNGKIEMQFEIKE